MKTRIVALFVALALTGCGYESSSAPGETLSVMPSFGATNGRGDGLNDGYEQSKSVHTWTNGAQLGMHRAFPDHHLRRVDPATAERPRPNSGAW